MIRKAFLILLALCTVASAHAYMVQSGKNPVDMIYGDHYIFAFKCRFGDGDYELFFLKRHINEHRWEMRVYRGESPHEYKWSGPINWELRTNKSGQRFDTPTSFPVYFGDWAYAVKINDAVYFVNKVMYSGSLVELHFFRLIKNSKGCDIFTMRIETDSPAAENFVSQFDSSKMKGMIGESFHNSELDKLRDRVKDMPVYDFSDTPEIVPDLNNKHWKQFFELGKPSMGRFL